MKLLTKGQELAQQAAGVYTCIPMHHPDNRAALRKLYKEQLNRAQRRAVFGHWRRHVRVFPEWAEQEHKRQAALQEAT